MDISKEKWHYLKKHAEKLNVCFLRCDGVVYECRRSYFATGPSPRWSIEEIIPVTIPPFVPEWYLDEQEEDV